MKALDGVAAFSRATILDEAKRLASRRNISVKDSVESVNRIIDAIEPQELGSDIVEIAGRLLGDLLDYFSAAQAVEILKTEDISRFISRMRAAEYLAREDVPFLSFDDLVRHTHEFAEFLIRHREFIVAHGLPPEYFDPCPWLHVQLARLYDTRMSTNYPSAQLFANQRSKSPSDQKPPYNWFRTPISKAYSLSDIEHCEYCQASLLTGMSEQEASRIEQDRPRLFDIKIAILRRLSELSSRPTTATTLWKACLGELINALHTDDLEFYLDMDRWYLAGKSHFAEVIAWRPKWSPGGVLNLLDVIGWFTAELKTKIIESAYAAKAGVLPSALKALSSQEEKPRWVYFGLLALPKRQSINLVLDELTANVVSATPDLAMLAAQMEADISRIFHLPLSIGLPPKHIQLLPEPASYTLGESGSRDLAPAVVASESNQNSPNDTDNSFLEIKSGWRIKFKGGEEQHYPKLDGLLYISTLVFQKNEPLSSQDLGATKTRREAKGASVDRLHSETTETLEDSHIHVSSDAGKKSDKEALQEYGERLQEIETELERAKEFNDESQSEALQKEKEDLLEHVKSVLGLHGRRVTLSPAAKLATDKVRNAIKRAISTIKDQDKQLATHLHKSIRCESMLFTYSPEDEISWTRDF